MVDVAQVERVLHGLYVAAEGTGLRREDRKKAREIVGILREVGRLPRGRVLVDAAAGKAYAGFLSAELLGVDRVVVIERDPARVTACRAAAARLASGVSVDVRAGDVQDAGVWPPDADTVVALHACGAASDAILDASVRARVRRLLLVPCCYGAGVAFAARAEALAEAAGVPRHAEVRRRAVVALIDAWRTLRLEAAGYETTVVPFVPPTVSPHNLLWRARRVGEPGRMREAGERLARLTR